MTETERQAAQAAIDLHDRQAEAIIDYAKSIGAESDAMLVAAGKFVAASLGQRVSRELELLDAFSHLSITLTRELIKVPVDATPR